MRKPTLLIVEPDQDYREKLHVALYSAYADYKEKNPSEPIRQIVVFTPLYGDDIPDFGPDTDIVAVSTSAKPTGTWDSGRKIVEYFQSLNTFTTVLVHTHLRDWQVQALIPGLPDECFVPKEASGEVPEAWVKMMIRAC